MLPSRLFFPRGGEYNVTCEAPVEGLSEQSIIDLTNSSATFVDMPPQFKVLVSTAAPGTLPAPLTQGSSGATSQKEGASDSVPESLSLSATVSPKGSGVSLHQEISCTSSTEEVEIHEPAVPFAVMSISEGNAPEPTKKAISSLTFIGEWSTDGYNHHPSVAVGFISGSGLTSLEVREQALRISALLVGTPVCGIHNQHCGLPFVACISGSSVLKELLLSWSSFFSDHPTGNYLQYYAEDASVTVSLALEMTEYRDQITLVGINPWTVLPGSFSGRSFTHFPSLMSKARTQQVTLPDSLREDVLVSMGVMNPTFVSLIQLGASDLLSLHQGYPEDKYAVGMDLYSLLETKNNQKPFTSPETPIENSEMAARFVQLAIEAQACEMSWFKERIDRISELVLCLLRVGDGLMLVITGLGKEELWRTLEVTLISYWGILGIANIQLLVTPRNKSILNAISAFLLTISPIVNLIDLIINVCCRVLAQNTKQDAQRANNALCAYGCAMLLGQLRHATASIRGQVQRFCSFITNVSSKRSLCKAEIVGKAFCKHYQKVVIVMNILWCLMISSFFAFGQIASSGVSTYDYVHIAFPVIALLALVGFIIYANCPTSRPSL